MELGNIAASVLALVVLAARATAQEGGNTPPPAAIQKANTGIDEDLDRAVLELRKKVWLKTPAHEDFVAVRQLIDARDQSRPEVDVVLHAQTVRLQRALDALDERRGNDKLDVAHVDMFREELVDSRLDATLERAREIDSDGQAWTAELAQFDELLRTRAEAGLTFDPRAAEFPRVLEKLLVPLRDEAHAGTLSKEHLLALRQLVTETRIDHAIGVLEKRLAANDLTPDMAARLRGIVQDEELRAKDEDRPAVRANYERLLAALDQLEQHAHTGQVSAEDVAQVREAVAHRPREANVERGKDG